MQLKKLPTKQIVFVDTAERQRAVHQRAVGARAGRIITATRNGAEQYTTLFGGYFVDALTGEEADADKNKRVTMLEAFQFAKAEVQRAYEQEGLLSTEHALLDDNGDKDGQPGPGADRQATARSRRCWRSARRPTRRRCRPIRSCARSYLERRDLEHRVESLRLLKDSMDPAKYQSELEKLVTAISR